MPPARLNTLRKFQSIFFISLGGDNPFVAASGTEQVSIIGQVKKEWSVFLNAFEQVSAVDFTTVHPSGTGDINGEKGGNIFLQLL